MKYRLAFVGFGVVGQGLGKILVEKKKFLKEKYDFDYSVVGICDMIKGSIVDEEGVDLKGVLRNVKKNKKISDKKIEPVDMIKNTNADIVIEVTYTDLKTGEPAFTHIKTALENRKHVVTTNKGPIALKYKELKKVAEKNNVMLRFEGTVLSGTPSLSLSIETLAGAEIKSVKGIVNGTTNYILTEMEKGRKYEDVLRKAQQLGYAEADPKGDVEGWDAVGKAVILANTVMGGDLKIKDVGRKGITKITLRQVEAARDRGKKIKLLAKVWKEKGKIKASVKPEELPFTDVLSNVSGVTNALTFETGNLGSVTIVGPGAGGVETGQALLNDMLAINRMVR
jgi:homoserine dehydrogenase